MTIEGISISDLVKATGLRRNTIEVRLHRLGIKPIINELLYPLETLDAIRNVKGKGRPPKKPSDPKP
jgi:hypothetical protein